MGKRGEQGGRLERAALLQAALALAEQRAKSVLDYLKRKGIAEERLEAQGFGSERPMDTSGTEEGRAKNRRIEMVIARISPPPAASSSSAPVPPPAPRP